MAHGCNLLDKQDRLATGRALMSTAAPEHSNLPAELAMQLVNHRQRSQLMVMYS